MKKLKVNISTPSNWEFENFLRLHSPGQKNIWDEFHYYHNRNSGSFDFWVVLEQPEATTKLKIPKGNCFFITMEERDVVAGYDNKYLEQFDHVITSRSDISHHHILKTHYFTKWHIHKSYDELKASMDQPIVKLKNLSAVISSRIQYGQHQTRYGFINKLKGHFKDDLDWYSKNENPISDKWDGLAPYKYSIAIENSSHKNYFTEKLVDVILCDSVPIYWGAPNACDYFPEELIISIPIEDFKTSIDIIEESINTDLHTKVLPLFRECKNIILDQYQFLPWLSGLLRANHTDSSCSLTKKIYRERDIRFGSRLINHVKNLIRQ